MDVKVHASPTDVVELIACRPLCASGVRDVSLQLGCCDVVITPFLMKKVIALLAGWVRADSHGEWLAV